MSVLTFCHLISNCLFNVIFYQCFCQIHVKLTHIIYEKAKAGVNHETLLFFNKQRKPNRVGLNIFIRRDILQKSFEMRYHWLRNVFTAGVYSNIIRSAFVNEIFFLSENRRQVLIKLLRSF